MGCSPPTGRPDLTGVKVGDCVKLGGTPDQPEAAKAPCGSYESNFKVVAPVADARDGASCPADVDSSYSLRRSSSHAHDTICLDIDWVVGGCMSVDPRQAADPFRVDCDDASVLHRQRATEILTGLAPPVTVDLCASGQGYAYTQRRFAVCVEDADGRVGS